MQFNTEWLADPTVFAVGTLPPHSDHSFEDATGAATRLDLNGAWYFHYAPTLAERPQGFEQPAYDVRGWQQIQVPGHIQLQGNGAYGTPQYTNVAYPWDGVEDLPTGGVPTQNPVGSYARHFTLPPAWQSRAVLLRLEGAESAVALWCNGSFVGYSENSFSPMEFDLAPHLRPGENKLAVQVFRFCTGSWLEDMDFWRFFGIYRDVYLLSPPAVHIWNADIRALPAQDWQSGTLHCRLSLAGAAAGSVRLQCAGLEATAPIEEDYAEVSVRIDAPRLWSAEQPTLYAYSLTVLNPAGQPVERVTGKAGFRHFTVEGGLLRLNGKPILFKGVNRHEWNCRTGRAVTREDMVWDIQTMKRNNINAVRASHYPNQSLWYELCDEYGLYVIDEVGLETHATWVRKGVPHPGPDTLPGDKPEWRAATLHRAAQLYEHHKNHPSILLWSLGNECCGGSTLHEMAGYFRGVDATRPVHYEGIYHDLVPSAADDAAPAEPARRFPDTSDVESQMYIPAEKAEAYIQSHPGKPFILCEYSHSMGNSNGGLYAYAELARRQPRYQGGFIWDWIDQALLGADPNGQPALLYGGDFGDRPHDGDFCGNGLVFANRVESPKLQEVKALYADFRLEVGPTQVVLHNESLFSSTAGLDLVVRLCREGQPLQTEVYTLDVPPGGSAGQALPFGSLPADCTVDAALCLRTPVIWAPRGHELAFGQYAPPPAPLALPVGATPPRLVQGNLHAGVHGQRWSATFSRQQGRLTGYERQGLQLLLYPPEPNLWRAPTLNDRGWNMPFHFAGFDTAGACAVPESESITQNADNQCLAFAHRLALPGSPLVHTEYRLYAGGWMDITLTWQGPEMQAPDFGLIFQLPLGLDRVDYYGLGPQENYSDRCHGARLGRYAYTAMQNLTPYLVPGECGNRTGVRFATVTDGQGRGLRFESETGMDFCALPYTPAELAAARHSYELPPATKTVVKCSLGQMGVAGDDSWGAQPLPAHRLRLVPGTAFRLRLGSTW